MNAFYKRKFFILTAHPDDAESACGGLISKIIKICRSVLFETSMNSNTKCSFKQGVREGTMDRIFNF